MHNEQPEFQAESHLIDLQYVPDWHRYPGSGLWEFGHPISDIQLTHNPETVKVDPGVLALKNELEAKKSANSFTARLLT